MATQSRVRRLIGRRRAGLDRYIGVLSREVGQSQDNVDPITELLTQLSGSNNSSGGGGGGGESSVGIGRGRRLITEFPPHIQQLLDQQDRQGFERGSPLRRPVYRKVVAGGGGGVAPPMQYDGPLPTYLLPGHPLEVPHSVKGSISDSSRGLLAEPILREADRGGVKSERDSPFLLANYNLPEPSGSEKAELEEQRTNKSMFVQELLLSTLAYTDSSSSSSNSDASDHEQT